MVSQRQYAQALRKALSEKFVVYTPTLRRVADSVLGALFLRHAMFLASDHLDGFFFYFNAPSNHPVYNKDVGNSWQDALAFTRSELETARKAIGTKITYAEFAEMRDSDMLNRTTGVFTTESGNQVVAILPRTQLCLYWTDRQNITHYHINSALLDFYLIEATQKYTQDELFQVAQNLENDYHPALPNATIQHSGVIQSSIPEGYNPAFVYKEREDIKEDKREEKELKDSASADSAPSIHSLSGKGETSIEEKKPDKKENITLKEAVQEVWGVNGKTGSILTQLCGNAKKTGTRKEFVLSGKEGTFRLMDTAQEVLAFKAFWDSLDEDYLPDTPPSGAEALYERIEQFREHTDYADFMVQGGRYITYLLGQKGNQSAHADSEALEPTPLLDEPPVNEDFLRRKAELYAQFKR